MHVDKVLCQVQRQSGAGGGGGQELAILASFFPFSLFLIQLVPGFGQSAGVNTRMRKTDAGPEGAYRPTCVTDMERIMTPTCTGILPCLN